jgi:hypothetical protein
MPNTFELIASSTVTGATAASIDFTSIPSTYTDLVVKYSLRANATDGADAYDLILTLNTTSTITSRVLRGNGSTAASNSITDRILRAVNVSNWTANTFSNGELYIPNYTSSNNKSWSNDAVTENNATSADMGLTAGLTSISAAITTIKLAANNASLVTNSTAYLYGVKNA